MIMATFWRDIRFAARLLARSPGFSLIAVAALALGIGANTAIFSVVNRLLINPLPYKDPSNLVVVWERNLPRDRKNNVVSPGNFLHWREMTRVFEDLAAVSLTFRTTLTGGGAPEELPVQYVTAALSPILGVPPEQGRLFVPEDDAPSTHVVIISDRLWRRRFGADPKIINQPIQLDGVSQVVVGVMPPGFSILDKAVDLWVPIGFGPEARTPRGRWLMVVGRLRPGVTVTQAQDDMTRVHAELTRMFPAFNTGWTARVVSLSDQLTGDVRPALFVMLAAVGCVLLIACANVANLLLARATARHRELAVRAALGAGRGRLVRQLLAESLLLSAIGGFAGLLLAWWSTVGLRTIVAKQLPIPRLESVSLDTPVLLFTLGATIISGLAFGLVPAVTAARTTLTDAMKEGGRGGTSARGARARSAFVIVEVALALVLLVGAGLLIRSFNALLSVDPGFDPSHTVTMKVSIPTSRVPRARTHPRFLRPAVREDRRRSWCAGRRRHELSPVERARRCDRLRDRRPCEARTRPGTGDRCPRGDPRLLPGNGHPSHTRSRVRRYGRRLERASRDHQRQHGAPVLAKRGSNRPADHRVVERSWT